MTVGEISVYWEFLTFPAIDTKYVPLKLMYPAKNILSEVQSVFISKYVCNKRGPPQLSVQIRSLEMFPSPQGWSKCRKTKPYQLIYSRHFLWWILSSKIKNLKVIFSGIPQNNKVVKSSLRRSFSIFTSRQIPDISFVNSNCNRPFKLGMFTKQPFVWKCWHYP